MMERHNRRSHLAPQLSPSTEALLRSDNSSSPSKDTSTTASSSQTPTSGEIPIAGENDPQTSQSAPAAPIDHQTTHQPAIHRVLSAGVNGSANMFPSQASSNDSPLNRPSFPPRTSSASVLAQGRPREPEPPSNLNPTVLPIRPAPPPQGPLPQPPTGSLRTTRRQGMTSMFQTNGEAH